MCVDTVPAGSQLRMDFCVELKCIARLFPITSKGSPTATVSVLPARAAAVEARGVRQTEVVTEFVRDHQEVGRVVGPGTRVADVGQT